jgi:hypothetical protein
VKPLKASGVVLESEDDDPDGFEDVVKSTFDVTA